MQVQSTKQALDNKAENQGPKSLRKKVLTKNITKEQNNPPSWTLPAFLYEAAWASNRTHTEYDPAFRPAVDTLSEIDVDVTDKDESVTALELEAVGQLAPGTSRKASVSDGAKKPAPLIETSLAVDMMGKAAGPTVVKWTITKKNN